MLFFSVFDEKNKITLFIKVYGRFALQIIGEYHQNKQMYKQMNNKLLLYKTKQLEDKRYKTSIISKKRFWQ